MTKKILLSIMLVLGVSGVAMAAHCPVDAKSIDAALVRSDLSDAQKSEIKALRDEGMDLHKSGDHRKSEANMAKAMRMLLEGNLK